PSACDIRETNKRNDILICRIGDIYICLVSDELSLAELAAHSGLQPRTIRSWVARGLLPSPLTRGPMARYPAETLERLRAIRAMQEILRRPLAEIRQELLVATPDALRELADKAKGLSPEPVEYSSATPSTALEYIRHIREGQREP